VPPIDAGAGAPKVTALSPVACAAVLWREAGVDRVTVILGAAFAMVHEGRARLAAPRALVAADLAPRLPGARVVLSGHAHAPGRRPTPAMPVRLAVLREGRAVLDRTLHVFGPRAAAPGSAPRPFVTMPLGSRVADPIDDLRGDEQIVIEGVHPLIPRLETRLPGARAEVRAYPAADGAGRVRPMDLVADTLIVDADRRVVSMLWRGDAAVEDLAGGFPAPRAPAEALARLRFLAGLEMPGRPVAWPPGEVAPARPSVPPASSKATVPAPPPEAVHTLPALPGLDEDGEPLGTMRIDLWAEAQAALPFDVAGFHAPAPADPASAARPAHDALPFRPPAAGSTRPPPPPADPPAPQAPPDPFAGRSAAVWADDREERTQALDLSLVAQRPLAPFAVPEPRATPVVPAAPLPGAPWSGIAAPPLPEIEDPFAHTGAIVMPWAPAAAPPPPLPPPPAVVDPEPPLRVAPPPPVPEPPGDEPSVAPPPAPPAPPAPEPPQAAPEPPPPEPAAAPAPAPPAAPAARDRVIAALAAGEPLDGADLAGADLHGLDLRRAALAGARLARCDLTDARLGEAQLSGADLSGATLTRADLSGANLTRAVLDGAHLDGAVLSEATFEDARGAGASFVGASGRRPSFARGTWKDAAFDRLNAAGADFTAAALDGASFRGALLQELCLADAHGARAVFDGARMQSARAAGATLTAGSFKGAEAAGSVWERATLDTSDFGGADLARANLSRASCARAAFVGAKCNEANLTRLTGDGADFSDASLVDADLRQARLHGATFDRASLSGVVGNKADLSKSRFVRANLTSAVLRAGKLTEANLAHAVLTSADLRDADLDRANLFGASRATAKLAGARMNDTVEVDPEGGG
jgi:uncharacterized protein YjbI with pentapeptide repeats